MDKSPEAFRTISEVAEALETPAHVLRFWESRFPQIRPVKRAGGRRYYRPSDVALLAGIKRLLHDEGMTIRGVQKILREHGVRHVSGLSDDSSPEAEALEAAMVARHDAEAGFAPAEAAEATAAALQSALDGSNVIAFPPADPPAAAAPEEPMPLHALDPRQTHLPGFEPEPEPLIEAEAELATEPGPQEVPPPPPEAPPAPPAEAPPAPPAEAPPAPPKEVPLDSPPPESSPEAPPADPPAPEAAAGDLSPAEAAVDEAPAPETPAPESPMVESPMAESQTPAAAAPVAPPGPRRGGRAEPAPAVPTVAARLRSLPAGRLQAQQQALGALAERIAALRARLGNPPPGA